MEQQRTPNNVAAIAGIGLAVVLGIVLLALLTGRNPDTSGLVGRTWQLAAITGQTPAFQGVLPPEEQPRYTVAFAADNTFSARADCNTVAGTYALSGPDGITITPGPSTLVACPDGSYGSLFAHALGTVTTWVIAESELTLTTSDGGTGTFVEGTGEIPTDTPSPSESPSPTESPTPSLTPSPTASPTASPTPSASPSPSPTPTATATDTETPEPTETATATPTVTPSPSPTPTPAPTPSPTPTPPPGADLVGTSWQLTSATTVDPVWQGVVPEAERSKYTVAFAADGAFSAIADCNTLAGRWTATATGGLSITPGPSSIVACPEGSLGDLYVLALTNSASYAIANDGLTITLRDGGTLVYEPTS
jgi:heat shock protein HslJ